MKKHTKTELSKHTPGPWFTCPQTTKPHQHALVGIGNGSVHVGYASVTPALSPFESDANARLIAASPELLADLIEARRVIQRLLNCTPDEATDLLTNHTEEFDAIGAAAIAKATGATE